MLTYATSTARFRQSSDPARVITQERRHIVDATVYDDPAIVRGRVPCYIAEGVLRLCQHCVLQCGDKL